MMYEKKLKAALELLATTGIWRSNYSPPLFRLLWLCGVRVPPPHFRSFVANTTTLGSFFGIAWGMAMWLLVWRGEDRGEVILAASALAGLLFGLCMAAYYQHGQRKHALPDWETLDDG